MRIRVASGHILTRLLLANLLLAWVLLFPLLFWLLLRCLRHIRLELLVSAVPFSHLSIGLRFVGNELVLRRGWLRLDALDRHVLRDDLSLSLIRDLLKLKLKLLLLSRRLRLSQLCLAVVES